MDGGAQRWADSLVDLQSDPRIPGTGLADYLSAAGLARASATATVAEAVRTRGPMWSRFWEPLCLAVLNTDPEEASARLLWTVVRETFGRGGDQCRPLVADKGLAVALVDPAVAHLRAHGVGIHFSHRVRGIEREGRTVRTFDLGSRTVALSAGDHLVLAVPPTNAAALLPELTVPDEARPIVNAHFRLDGPPDTAPDVPFLGLVGGTAQWLFLRDDVVSITVSSATDLVDVPPMRLPQGSGGIPPEPWTWRRRRRHHRASSRSGAPPSRRPPRRSTGVRALGPQRPICCWPATGRIPVSRPQSKVRCARVMRQQRRWNGHDTRRRSMRWGLDIQGTVH